MSLRLAAAAPTSPTMRGGPARRTGRALATGPKETIKPSHIVPLALAALGVFGLAHHGTARAGGPRPTKLVFTEATYHPRNTPNWHWLELYNGTGKTIDLSTYVVDMARGSGSYFTAANLKGSLPAGKVAILYPYGIIKGTCKTESGCEPVLQAGLAAGAARCGLRARRHDQLPGALARSGRELVGELRRLQGRHPARRHAPHAQEGGDLHHGRRQDVRGLRQAR
jgi:hypothetical protein